MSGPRSAGETKAAASDATAPACRACLQPIAPGARVCHHCGTSQTRASRAATALKWAAGTLTLVSLVGALYNLNGIYRSYRERRAAVAQLVTAAQRLLELGDQQRAWELYEQALELDPASPLARDGQIDAAVAWLLNAHVVGDETFASIVDPVLPVLARGLAGSDGERRGDLLALIGWAHNLERRARYVARVDIPSLFRRALEVDPDNVYGLTFLGHWTISEDRELEAGLDLLERAVDTGRERAFVWDFALGALRNYWHRSSSEERPIWGRAMLRLAHRMRVEGEPGPVTERQRTDTIRVYGSELAAESFQDVLPALPAEDHLALVRWLAPAAPSEEALERMRRFLEARLLEETGRREEALAGYRTLHEQVGRRYSLRAPLDAALERLTGQRTDFAKERGDPFGFHGRRLAELTPGSDAFESSLSALEARAYGDHLRFRPEETARMLEILVEVREDLGETADATGQHRLRAMIANLHLVRGELESAIEILSSLAGDLPAGNDRAYVLYNLACAYSLRAQNRGDPGMRSTDIDLSLDVLERAFQEGFFDRDEVAADTDLLAVRSEPRFQALIAE